MNLIIVGLSHKTAKKALSQLSRVEGQYSENYQQVLESVTEELLIKYYMNQWYN